MVEGSQLIRLAIFGRPVAQSLSPRIHGLFAEQFGLRREDSFDWRETERGPALTRRTSIDARRHRRNRRIVHDVEYESRSGRLLPARVTLRIPGYLPRDVQFEFRY